MGTYQSPGIYLNHLGPLMGEEAATRTTRCSPVLHCPQVVIERAMVPGLQRSSVFSGQFSDYSNIAQMHKESKTLLANRVSRRGNRQCYSSMKQNASQSTTSNDK